MNPRRLILTALAGGILGALAFAAWITTLSILTGTLP